MTYTRTPRSRLLAILAATTLAIAGLVAIPATAALAATFTVTDPIDDGAATVGSLRWAVANASSGDTINFIGVTQIILTGAVQLPVGVTIDGGSVAGGVVLGRNASFDQFVLLPATAGQSYTFRNLVIQGAVGHTGRGISDPNSPVHQPVDITLDTVQILNETAVNDGAGFFSDSATGNILFTSSVIQNNTNGATGSGAGAAVDTPGGKVTVTNTIFESNSNNTNGNGGGLQVENAGGAVTLSGDEFNSNASQSGGGLFVEGSTALSITGSKFSGNLTSNGGGGASMSGGSVSIDSTSFTGNESTGNRGGGLLVSGATVTVSNSSFTGNLAALVGGGIGGTGLGGTTTISGSTFSGNLAQNGGAIGESDLGSGSLDISTSTFTGNAAQAGGGALWFGVPTAPAVNSGSISIHRSTFSSNANTVAGQPGSSILLPQVSGPFLLEDSTVADDVSATSKSQYALSFGTVNYAGAGPAIEISSDTIVGPGGVHIDDDALGDDVVENSIVTSNTAALQALDATAPGIAFVLGYSILSDAGNAKIVNSGGNQFSVSAAALKLGALANNGGPTLTFLPAVDSPAHNTGDPTATLPGVFDQRGTGFLRVQQRLDIGAIEIQDGLLAPTGTPIAGGLLLALILLLTGSGAWMLRRRVLH